MTLKCKPAENGDTCCEKGDKSEKQVSAQKISLGSTEGKKTGNTKKER